MSGGGPAQHEGLTAERWSRFSADQRILMIANEMHRASRCLARGEEAGLAASYERALRLTDLTVAVAGRPALRRELLRWRGLLAESLLAGGDAADHRHLLEALLWFTPEAARQRPFLLGASVSPAAGESS